MTWGFTATYWVPVVRIKDSDVCIGVTPFLEITASWCQGTKEVLLLLPDDAAAVDPRLGFGTWRVKGLGNYTCNCKAYNPHNNPSYPYLLTYLIGSLTLLADFMVSCFCVSCRKILLHPNGSKSG